MMLYSLTVPPTTDRTKSAERRSRDDIPFFMPTTSNDKMPILIDDPTSELSTPRDNTTNRPIPMPMSEVRVGEWVWVLVAICVVVAIATGAIVGGRCGARRRR